MLLIIYKFINVSMLFSGTYNKIKKGVYHTSAQFQGNISDKIISVKIKVYLLVRLTFINIGKIVPGLPLRCLWQQFKQEKRRKQKKKEEKEAYSKLTPVN